MPIFPELNNSFYSEDEKYARDRVEAFYYNSITQNQCYWHEADVDNRFATADKNIWNEVYGNYSSLNNRNFNFDHIGRIVNMISGYQRRNRKTITTVPIENSDQTTSDQFTKIMMWCAQRDNMLETISESFTSSLISGISLLNLWMDYRSDPVSGNIRLDHCAYNSFLIDPFFRKLDLSDCGGILKRTYLSKAACISLLPDREEEIASLSPSSNTDGRFSYMPESYNYTYGNLLAYDEYHYQDFRKQKLLVDSTTGATMEWPQKSLEKDLRNYLNLFPQIKVIEQEIQTVKLSILVEGRVMYDGPNPSGLDSYPFIPVLAYYNPQVQDYSVKIQGVVRKLRDSQYIYNRHKIINLDILESQINSGYKYKENALVNPKDIFLSGQGKGLALKQDAQMTDVEKIPPAHLDPSSVQFSQGFAQEIMSISGVNEELMGSAVDDKAGILSMLRQGAGLTTLQTLFDNLDYAQKLVGRELLSLIQNNFTPGKVERIINEEPTQEFYSKAFGKYDVEIEEGFYTSTQRQLQFAQLLHLKSTGVPIPDDVLVDAATIQNKQKIIDSIQQQQQQAQAQQEAQQQSQMQQQAAETRLVNARATADEGLGVERLSRVEENKAMVNERLAEAAKDKEMALLNFVKALKELETIDIDNLSRLIAIERSIKEERVNVAEFSTPNTPTEVNSPAIPSQPGGLNVLSQL